MHIRQKLFFLNHSYNTAFFFSLLCYTLSMCFVSLRADSQEVHGFFLLLFGWMSFGAMSKSTTIIDLPLLLVVSFTFVNLPPFSFSSAKYSSLSLSKGFINIGFKLFPNFSIDVKARYGNPAI